MEELYELANEYYTKVKSFRGLQLYKKFTFWTFLITAFLFILYIICFLHAVLSRNIDSVFNRLSLIAFLSEFAMVLSWMNIQEWQKKRLVENLSNELKNTFESIKPAKVFLLENYFDCSMTSFSDAAKRIEKMLTLAIVYSNENSFVERFFSFIYNRDANSRILTLFVILCSLITALSISAGQNIHSLFEFYSNASWVVILTLYFQSVFIALALGYGVIELFKILKDIATFTKLHITSQRSKHIETVRFLISDLNNLHAFKKTEDSKIIIPPNPRD